MSEINVNQLLQQMRMMEAQAKSQPNKIATNINMNVGQTEQAQRPGFGDMLEKALDSVNEAQKHSGRMKKAYEVGEDVSLAEVMIASQKAGLSFQAMLQVRNKLVEAYRAIMSTPI